LILHRGLLYTPVLLRRGYSASSKPAVPCAWSETSSALRAEDEGAQVEGPMVQYTQGQPVALPVGAADLPPAQGKPPRPKPP
jgi:hypothetical protein